MALQGSGAIAFSDINVELGNSSSATINLDNADVRDLADVLSGAIDLSDFYGKSAFGFKTSATSNASYITWPSGLELNDLAIMVDIEGQAFFSPATVVPSGFTSIANDIGSGGGYVFRRIFSYKILTGGESGNLTGMSSSGYHDKVMLVFKADASSVTPSSVTWQLTANNPGAQNINASGGTTPLMAIGMVYSAGSTAAFSTETPAFEGTVATGTSDLLVGYTVYDSGSASNHTIDMNDLGSANAVSGFYIEVTQV